MSSEKQDLVNWAAISGEWAFDGQSALYQGPGKERLNYPYGIALSEASLMDGVVATEVTFPSGAGDNAARILMGFRSQEERYVTVGLGGYGRAYVAAEFRPEMGWISLQAVGSRTNIRKVKEYLLEVQVSGQRV